MLQVLRQIDSRHAAAAELPFDRLELGQCDLEAVEQTAHTQRILDLAYSCCTWCTAAIAIDPSPTADATRFKLPARTSPIANTPGRLVSSRWGARASGHCAAASSSGDRSGPVLMNALASSVRQPPSQRVLGTAPVMVKTCRMPCVSTRPVSLSRQPTRLDVSRRTASGTSLQDTALTIAAPGVLANDTDAD